MMSKDNLSQISQKLSEGKITPVDLFNQYSTEIAKQDGEIKAFREISKKWKKSAQEATIRWQNKQQKSPFDGIPIALKDNISTKNLNYKRIQDLILL